VDHLDTLRLNTPPPTSSPTQEFLHILCPDGARRTLYADLGRDTFGEVRAAIDDLCGVAPEDQELIHPQSSNPDDPIAPPDEDTPEDEGVGSGDTLARWLRTRPRPALVQSIARARNARAL